MCKGGDVVCGCEVGEGDGEVCREVAVIVGRPDAVASREELAASVTTQDGAERRM